ncbi:Riboflavin synthase [Actinidia chinensis var. chinensis]|uniref:Riboflavin synthase n=1 Tax=Actinidia chinensis var. chinensis TaxID=1590841 RepID=A0A2R6QC59_ACTCC|nr:Riboflavin synthase [Actinidia chinensis var. chinensis]
MAISYSLTSLSKTLNPSLHKPPRICNLLKTPTQTHLTPTLNLNLNPPPLSLLFTTHIAKSKSKSKSKSKPQSKSHLTPIRCLFTGIVEEMGRVQHLGSAVDGGFTMKILSKTVLEDVNLGDSIAVNGTCLTVTDFDTQSAEFTVGLSPETLRKTSLVELEPGSPVNLERALKPSTRMGGHFVQGHVDGTGEIVGKEREGDSLWVTVKAAPELLRYIVPKGFIAVDGTSLTVVKVFDEEGCFNFMLVDYTQQKVVIPLKEIGQKVNLEVDILGKYVERLLSSGFVNPIKSS